tara:strand:- start:2607 stop:3656 length:1050 start_codon:yes stop_codon:yes gene_type:complete
MSKEEETWSKIDTSKKEDTEDKVDFEVEKPSVDSKAKEMAEVVKQEVEVEQEKPVEEKVEVEAKEETQPVEQKSEEEKATEGIEGKRAEKRIRQLVRQKKEREEEVQKLLTKQKELEERLKTTHDSQFDLTKTSIESQEKSLENQLGLAKQNYLDAFEKDDKNQLLKAQEALNEAQINLNTVKNNKVSFEKDYESYQNRIKQQPLQQTPQQPQQQYDPKAVEWAEANEWFGKDRVMTAAALAVDTQLKEEGFDPSDDDFYKEVDLRIRTTFPTKFNDESQVRQKATSSPSQVVAGTSRTPASKKIKLTQEDVRLANKWNIPLDRYAKEKAKVEQTKEEYTTISTMRRSS